MATTRKKVRYHVKAKKLRHKPVQVWFDPAQREELVQAAQFRMQSMTAFCKLAVLHRIAEVLRQIGQEPALPLD